MLSLPAPYTARSVRYPERMSEILTLRARSWSTVRQNADSLDWRDDFDKVGLHWLVELGGELVASARLSLHSRITEVPEDFHFRSVLDDLPGPVASINRLVVDPGHRGKGLASYLDEERIRFAREAKCESVVVSTSSGPSRENALLALGFTRLGVSRVPGKMFGAYPVVLFLDLRRQGSGGRT